MKSRIVYTALLLVLFWKSGYGQVEKDTSRSLGSGQVSVFNLRATIHLYREKPEKALPLLQKAVQTNNSVPASSRTMSYNLLALAYYGIGAYDPALKACDSALFILDHNSDAKDGALHEQRVMALNTKANLLFIQGAYNEAALTIDEAEQICADQLSPDHKYTIFTAINHAAFYQYIGDYEQAYTLLMKAKRGYEKNRFHSSHRFILLLNNLAFNRTRAGDSAMATEYFETAKTIAQKRFGKRSWDYALVMHNNADFYTNTNKYCQAESAYKTAIAIRKRLVDTFGMDYIISTGNLGYLYKKMGRYGDARNLLEQLLPTIKQHYGENHKLYITTLNNLAVATYLSGPGHRSVALDTFKQGLSLQKEWLIGNYEILAEAEKKELLDQELRGYLDFWQQASIDSDNVSAEESYEYVAFYKGMQLADCQKSWAKIIVDQNASLIGLLDTYKVHKALYRTELNKNTETKRENRKRQEKLDSLTSLLNFYEHELNLRSGILQGKVEELTANAVQSKLASNEVFIDFSSYRTWDKTWTDQRNYIAYVIRSGQKTELIDLFHEAALKELLTGWYGAGGIDSVRSGFIPVSGIGELSIDLNKNFEGLHTLIFSKLEPYLKGCNRLTISPTGLLHLVNFSALTLESGKRLGSTYQIELVSSLRSVIGRDSTPSSIFRDSSIALFGGIDYGQCLKKTSSIAVSEFPWLSGARLEVEKIHLAFINGGFQSTLVQSKAATEESFVQLSKSSPEIIHLATHGYFQKTDNGSNFDPMLRSGLAMAGVNEACINWDSLSFLDQGALTAYEVSQLDLSNTRLVVLSACETGLGDIDASEGVFGLQRAFKMVGVDYLLISLWSVPDKETQELMTLFYQNLLKNEGSVHTAFYKAQNFMAKKYSNEPHKWAAFILIE